MTCCVEGYNVIQLGRTVGFVALCIENTKSKSLKSIQAHKLGWRSRWMESISFVHTTGICEHYTL